MRAVTIAGLFALPLAQGVTQYWDTNGTTPGNGNAIGIWGQDPYWATSFTGGTTGTVDYIPGSDVVFSAATGFVLNPDKVSVITTQSATAQLANSITFRQTTLLTFSSIPSGKGLVGKVQVAAGGITLEAGSGGVILNPNSNPLPILLGATQTWTNKAATDFNVADVSAVSVPVVLTLADSGTGTGKIQLFGVVANSTAGGATSLVINRTNAAGLVNLAGTNTFTGSTTLTAGYVLISNAAAFGGAGNTVNFNGGAIIASSPQTLVNTTNYRIGGDFSVGGVIGTTNYLSKIKLASGTLDVLNPTRTVTLYQGNATVTVANAQLGMQATSVTSTGGAGVLRILGGAGTSTPAPGIFAFEGATTFASGVGFSIGNKAATVFSAANLISGNPDITVETGGVLNLSDGSTGSQSQTIGALNGAGTVLNDTPVASTATLTLGGANPGSFSGVIQDSGFSQINGKVALNVSKSSAATTQTLTGTNTYSGSTTVTSGTLLVNGSHTGGDAYAVATGATLGGLGSITSAVNVTGTLAPGAGGIGNLATGTVTFAAGSTLAAEINTTAATADQLNVTGDVVTGGASVNLVLTDLGTHAALAGGTKLVVVKYSGTWIGTDVLSYNGVPVPDGSTVTLGVNTFTVAYSDTSSGTPAMTLTAKSPFQNWIDGFATQLPNPADRLPAADPDGDGLSNLLEFALDGNPADVSNKGRMIFSTTDTNAPGLSVTLAVRKDAVLGAGPNNSVTLTVDGIVYLIQGSETLTLFDKAIEEISPASPMVPPPDAAWTARTFHITDSVGLPDKRFLRVGVWQP